MRDVTTDPKYKSGNATPLAFHEGDHVLKADGDYRFSGVVVSVFRKRSGTPRYVVENDDGVLHIFSTTNLVRTAETDRQ